MTSPPRTTTPAKRAERSGLAARIRLGAFRPESKDYLLLLGTVLFLVVLGLVMVLSSSQVESALANDGDFTSRAAQQATYALIGVPVMLLAGRMPEGFWMRIAWLVLAVSCVLQLLVVATPLGVEVGGNTNWLRLGPVQFQPSELIKVSLVLWLGLIVTKKQGHLGQFGQGVMPILIVAGGAIGLVLLGGDLGTVMVMATMLLGTLFLIGVPLRLLALPLLFGATAFTVAALSSESRMRRITAFLEEDCTRYNLGDCWQIQHGTFAMANGGVFGVGLGNSAAKWSWLPAADNDFIFAIIGEELGLVGAVVVIGMFVVLAIALARVMRSAATPFGRTVSAAVLVWVVGQACVNIGVVLGVFPVLGVPLPLVSAGGTALLTTLFAIGVVLSVAREPGPAGATARRSGRGAKAARGR